MSGGSFKVSNRALARHLELKHGIDMAAARAEVAALVSEAAVAPNFDQDSVVVDGLTYKLRHGKVQTVVPARKHKATRR